MLNTNALISVSRSKSHSAALLTGGGSIEMICGGQFDWLQVK